jgi:anti-anti-sigma factor
MHGDSPGQYASSKAGGPPRAAIAARRDRRAAASCISGEACYSPGLEMEHDPFTTGRRSEADGRVSVHEPRGVLNGHAACYAWLDAIRREIQGGQSRIVLDLRGVTRIDSTGIGIIAAISASAMNAGGRVCLTGLSDRTRRLLETTHLLKVIQNIDDESEAIRECAGGA